MSRQAKQRTLSDLVWWTDADQAELDLLAHELAGAIDYHRLHCSVCHGKGPFCPKLLDAVYAVCEWREGRILRSRSEWLRAQLRALEDAT